MSLLNRWIDGWRKAKDHTAWKYAHLMFGDDHLPAPPDEDDEQKPPDWLVRATLQFSLFAERMEAIGQVVRQWTPDDVNSHRFHLEDVGRAVYSLKAIAALALDLRHRGERDLDEEVVVATLSIEEKAGPDGSYEAWEEVVVPAGWKKWQFQIRSDTSA